MTAFFLSILVAAQPPLDCHNARTQTDMNQCAAISFTEADRELNEAWREVIAYVRRFDREFPPIEGDTRANGENRLRAAQRAWIVFRDEHCAVAGYEARGGTLEPLIYNGCRAGLTSERTEQLRGLVMDLVPADGAPQ
jgi:uncharacterized protein YecT (DUF1311 family)